MTELTPTQLRRQQRAWKAEKEDRRARAAYRNTLPQGVQALTAMLPDAPSVWHADIIQGRIDSRRAQYRSKSRDRRAREAARLQAAAEAEQDRRLTKENHV